MSVVELRVELPSYAHSFTIEVPTSATIVDVKQEIFRTCPGAPKVDGQRLIWRGRYLKDDERVEDIWKLSTESRIIHLAVHPSAWSKGPPSVQAPQVSQPRPTPTIPAPSNSSIPTTTVNHPVSPSTSVRAAAEVPSAFRDGRPHPMQYVMMKHTQALETLMGLASSTSPVLRNQGLRNMAATNVEKHGYIWPSILDEDFPPQAPGGLIYDLKSIDGQEYLSLRRPVGTPTAAQRHAINVLTYTFSLLQLISDAEPEPTPAVTTVEGASIPLHVNDLLQQLGLGHLEVAGADALPVEVQQVHQRPNQRPNPAPVLPAVREIAIAPFFFLVLRTLLLLYFIAPTRKPFLVILVLLWTLYEIWRPIQNLLMRIHREAGDTRRQENAAEPQPPQPANNAAGGEAVPNQQGRQQEPNIVIVHVGLGLGLNNLDEQVLNGLANQNIAEEDTILNAVDGPGTEEPGFFHKLKTMATLAITTIHPAVWNRRRLALRPREGRLRTEANMRNTLPNENDEASESRQHIRAELLAQHARRPRWVRDYIERVVAAEWVDDSD